LLYAPQPVKPTITMPRIHLPLHPSFIAGLLACALSAGCATAARLPKAFEARLSKVGVPLDAVSVVVAPVQAGAPALLRVNAQQPRNPASVAKLVTTAAALDTLGPDFVWHTNFYGTGPVQSGLLLGDMVIRGGGDPKFVVERITEAMQALREQGLKNILGDLVLDNSAFAVPTTDAGSFDGEALRPYNVQPDALLVNFKSVILKFDPKAKPGTATVTVEPPMAGLDVPSTVRLRNGRCGDWRSKLGAKLEHASTYAFTGSYPKACGKQEWPVAYVAPEQYAGKALLGIWQSLGGTLSGRVRMGVTPPNATLLLSAPSLPLRDIIADVNKFSNNVMAQQVFLTLGLPSASSPEAVAVADAPTASGITTSSAPTSETGATRDSRAAPASPAAGKLVTAFEAMMPSAHAATSPPLPTSQARELQPATFESARSHVQQWWLRSVGTAVDMPVTDNGSGLSRDGRVTADALLALLRHEAGKPNFEDFYNSLSIAGVDGTVSRMGRDGSTPFAVGNARLKTGTLKDVTAIAGYVTGKSGQQYVVAALVNHDDAPKARSALYQLVEWAANQ
jgi:serine-type D-Ala-D-Ala carboxypeptidase/endopeptidase (penicillin-binding protein 4)